MATIYDFPGDRAPRKAQTTSQSAEEEARQTFDTQLSAYLCAVEETKEFARTCAEACELDSLEQMIEQRDQLIRYWLKKRTAHAGS